MMMMMMIWWRKHGDDDGDAAKAKHVLSKHKQEMSIKSLESNEKGEEILENSSEMIEIAGIWKEK